MPRVPSPNFFEFSLFVPLRLPASRPSVSLWLLHLYSNAVGGLHCVLLRSCLCWPLSGRARGRSPLFAGKTKATHGRDGELRGGAGGRRRQPCCTAQNHGDEKHQAHAGYVRGARGSAPSCLHGEVSMVVVSALRDRFGCCSVVWCAMAPHASRRLLRERFPHNAYTHRLHRLK